MYDADKALLGNSLLGQLCTPSEAEELSELARSYKIKGVDYGTSVLSLAQHIQAEPSKKEVLLLLARRSKDERDARLETIAFISETRTSLLAQVERGRSEGDAKREFREKMIDFMKRGWPLADDATLYLTLGQSFLDTPGVWHVNVETLVVALRNLRRFG